MSLLITTLRLVPKNALSRAVGGALRVPWPRPVVRAAIGRFSRAYGVHLEEAEGGPDDWRTFSDFFTRRLKAGLRPLAPGDAAAVSPVDGTVGESGSIAGGTLVQVKGKRYTTAELLADAADAREYEGGSFVTLYLAPSDYHRVHAPLAGRITGYTYVPGHLWPVNEKGVAEIDRLFAVNERLITHLETAYGKVALVKVGATCVGRIRATYDDVVTNSGRARGLRRVRYDRPFELQKGAECGVFEMGSTVIVLFQARRAALDPGVRLGAKIRLGRPLARMTLAR